MTTMRIKLRRDTRANWGTANPTLAEAEAGVETDTRNMKLGDGSTAWADLPYHGAAWDDLRVEPTARNTGAKAPTFGTAVGSVAAYQFDDAGEAQEKELFFNVQLPHGWAEGGTIHPHIHWLPTSTESAKTVRWGLEYTVATPGGTFTAPGTIFGTAFQVGETTQNVHCITEMPAVTMTDMKVSTVLMCRLYRNSSHADDSFTGVAALLYTDFHVYLERLGSAEEWTV